MTRLQPITPARLRLQFCTLVTILTIGAGLSGCAVKVRLDERGLSITNDDPLEDARLPDDESGDTEDRKTENPAENRTPAGPGDSDTNTVETGPPDDQEERAPTENAPASPQPAEKEVTIASLPPLPASPKGETQPDNSPRISCGAQLTASKYLISGYRGDESSDTSRSDPRLLEARDQLNAFIRDCQTVSSVAVWQGHLLFAMASFYRGEYGNSRTAFRSVVTYAQGHTDEVSHRTIRHAKKYLAILNACAWKDEGLELFRTSEVLLARDRRKRIDALYDAILERSACKELRSYVKSTEE